MLYPRVPGHHLSEGELGYHLCCLGTPGTGNRAGLSSGGRGNTHKCEFLV